MKLFLAIILIIYSNSNVNCQKQQIKFDGSFHKLSDSEKKMIVEFNENWLDTTFDYTSDSIKFRFQKINADNIKLVCKKSDTTIVIIFQPWCDGSESKLESIKTLLSNLTKGLRVLLVAESYYVHHIYDLAERYKIDKPFYIIDDKYGNAGEKNWKKLVQELTPAGAFKIWSNELLILDKEGTLTNLTTIKKFLSNKRNR